MLFHICGPHFPSISRQYSIFIQPQHFFFFNCDAANLCAIRHPRPYNQSIISYILTWTIKWCRRATAELINTINNAQIFSNIFSLFTLNETLANIRIFSSFDCLLSFNIHVFLLFTFYNVFVQPICLFMESARICNRFAWLHVTAVSVLGVQPNFSSYGVLTWDVNLACS